MPQMPSIMWVQHLQSQEQMTTHSPSLLCSTWLFLATADRNKSISVPARKCERSFYKFNFNYSFALQLDFPWANNDKICDPSITRKFSLSLLMVKGISTNLVWTSAHREWFQWSTCLWRMWLMKSLHHTAQKIPFSLRSLLFCKSALHYTYSNIVPPDTFPWCMIRYSRICLDQNPNFPALGLTVDKSVSCLLSILTVIKPLKTDDNHKKETEEVQLHIRIS